MPRGLLFFAIFISAIGLGTLFFIETQTGVEVASREAPKEYSSTIKRHIANLKIRWHYFKFKVKKAWEKIDFGADDAPSEDQRKIVRWQDENGVWHFEHAPAEPDGS